MVLDPGPYPFKGEVVWLTPEQGGAHDEVPQPSMSWSYAHVGHVPPNTLQNGAASFVLRGWDPQLRRSPAEGKWLLVENGAAQTVVPGSVVVVSVGARPSALFFVHSVASS